MTASKIKNCIIKNYRLKNKNCYRTVLNETREKQISLPNLHPTIITRVKRPVFREEASVLLFFFFVVERGWLNSKNPSSYQHQ